MKRILPLVVLVLLSTGASAAPETQARVVSVDYVLALMDAGIDQKDIVRRIVEKNLTFRMAPGDIDRLREAGAGEELIEVVTAEQDTSEWERPSRLGTYAPGYSSFTFSYGYPYPYYYDPYYPYYYYAPYGHYAYYSSPYHHYPRYSYRTAPRGSG